MTPPPKLACTVIGAVTLVSVHTGLVPVQPATQLTKDWPAFGVAVQVL